jgi:hypothetical protein
MKPKFIVVHRTDPNNVGDIASNPLQYFLKPDEYQTVDVISLNKEIYNPDTPLIYGGGGLIGNEFIGNVLNQLFESADANQLTRMFEERWQLSDQKNKAVYDNFNAQFNTLVNEAISKIPVINAPRFIWGAGYNGDVEVEFEKIRWPKEFAKFRKVGIRDYHVKSTFDWVPCASCMHPAFDKKYTVKNDVIFFEHKKQLIKDFGQDPIPRFINSGSNVEQTIELLGSANIILTNSYHGAYWGTLLKKRVIVVGGAWSGKFKFFKHQPAIVGKKEHWKDLVQQTPIFDNALSECRTATLNYWNQIKGSV